MKTELSRLLLNLNLKERKEVMDYLRLLDSQEQVGAPEKDRELMLWTESLAMEMERVTRHRPRLFPLPVAMSGSIRTAFNTVSEFLNSAGLIGEGKTYDLQLIYQLTSQLMVQHARNIAGRGNFPISVKLVLNTATKLPGLFDSAFPGYLEAGMTKVILNHLKEANRVRAGYK